ncbi:MAG: RpiB/LacA/LacB family sugar-phosphate isomerase [Bdellovibrionales bacterium]|nr:RpiB/LacA/LacB family sugar-phosphate isomerase [Bdellovibrionales bacterium]
MIELEAPKEYLTELLIASDHAGYELKTELQKALPDLPWRDLGTHGNESVDYPDFADLMAIELQKETQFGVLICGSGQGIAIQANRHRNLRAALCWNESITTLSRLHNNANVICLGGRWIVTGEAANLVNLFLDTPFEGGRHLRRVQKLGCQ